MARCTCASYRHRICCAFARLSVTLMIFGHRGGVTWKVITSIISLGRSPNIDDLDHGNIPKGGIGVDMQKWLFRAENLQCL